MGRIPIVTSSSWIGDSVTLLQIEKLLDWAAATLRLGLKRWWCGRRLSSYQTGEPNAANSPNECSRTATEMKIKHHGHGGETMQTDNYEAGVVY